MAESPEHQFLSNKFLEVVEDFAKIKLYGYTEAERKKFDFACIFCRDWDRPLIGQTLWKHTEGIDKDIRSLLVDVESDIWAYVVRDNVRNRSLFHEVIQDYKKTEYSRNLFKLKVFWIPQDFDADDEQERETIGNILQNSIVDDLLFNVIFGNLTATDIRIFLNTSGRFGLNLAVLYEIAVNGFLNYPALSKRLEVSSGSLREKVFMLVGSGLIWQLGRGSFYYVSLKGRVFLEMLNKILEEVQFEKTELSYELLFVLNRLGLDATTPTYDDRELLEIHEWTPQVAFSLLLQAMRYALTQWDIDLRNRNYILGQQEDDMRFRVFR
ncbi:hypothetical protein H6F98_20630 [Microcoleus sp. FACHB-SPT15]|uniref:hypothetical protein n=1 Tax=Microcoleus sp. FACHB-SPT15 TaxID=2692830 RepID=UPI00178222F5|nr:hypothetical protein [Microcoleus sp. FACHB-SPT15]MBD1807837.1 hypothetical protein [Microcoleus sp. FACHB-SPT15]